MKIQELFEQYKGLKHEDLVKAGREAYAGFGLAMDKNGYDKKEVVAFATMLVRLAAGADKYGSKAEFELFQEVTGIPTDAYEFQAMAKNAGEEGFVKAIDEIVDSLQPAAKEAALRFAAIFFSADNHLSESEIALFKRLEA